ncbi:serine/threonine protein kinase, partial [Azotobacter beijerinckii]|nr:serine/threonine protein kinase [Azotobacter beijerinckii]
AGTDLAARSVALGRALRLEFLGRRAASRAPSLDSAWTSDRDPSDPLRPAFEVCVLVSRQQLGDFRQGLEAMVAALHQRRTTPEAFFQALAGSSARLLRDPATLGQGPLDGARLGEYLEGLPYLGTALGMTPTRWLSLSAAEQEAFVDELEAKIHLYEILLADPANWVRFGAAPADAALYRLPLSALP